MPFVVSPRMIHLLLLVTARSWSHALVLPSAAAARDESLARSFVPRRSTRLHVSTTPTTTTTTPSSSTSSDATIGERSNPLLTLPLQQHIVTADLSPGVLVAAAEAPAPAVSDSPPPGRLSLTLGRLTVLVAAAMFGTNFATVKMLDQTVPTSVSMALRFVLAAVAMTGSVVWQQRTLEKRMADRGSNGDGPVGVDVRNHDWVPAAWMGVEVGAWYLVGYLCQSYGLHYVAASKSAFFNSIAVIVVPLLDVLFRGKRLGAKGMASVATALTGVGLLQFGPSLLASAPEAASATTSALQLDQSLLSTITATVSFGDLLCLCQAVFFGIGYWRLERASRQYPQQSGAITAAQLVALGIGATLFCGLSGDVPNALALKEWLSDVFVVKALLWTGLVSTAFALYLETVALQIVSASELTVLMTSVSLWGSAFAFVTMGELLPPIGLVGGLLILGGCVLTAQSGGDDASDGAGTGISQDGKIV